MNIKSNYDFKTQKNLTNITLDMVRVIMTAPSHHVKNHLKGFPYNKIKKINIVYVFMVIVKYFRGCIFDVMELKS